MTSRMARIGFLIRIPTWLASGSHQAPSPRIVRPGASMSSAAKLWAIRAAFLVQIRMIDVPSRIRSVTAA